MLQMNNMSIYGIKLGKQEMKHIGVLPVLSRLTSMYPLLSTFSSLWTDKEMEERLMIYQQRENDIKQNKID
jgi:hypothetical protein